REVDQAMAQGFVLTRYFYDQFDNFEKGEIGFQDAFPDMLRDLNLNLGREQKRAREVEFAKQGSPDLVRATIRPTSDSLDAAEGGFIPGVAKAARRRGRGA